MIKLQRSIPPTELTPEYIDLLTKEFQETSKAVWQTAFIKEALLTQSNNKCAYCECELNIESKYLEIEHFACKSLYPEEVVVWENLLPSCKRCNAKKGSHDVRQEPIINPFDEDPREHIELRSYRMKDKTPIGELTIHLLDLNNVEQAVRARFEIGNQIFDNIDNLKEKLDAYEESSSSLRRSKVINSLEALLTECQPRAPYAATVATILHKESNYRDLMKRIIDLNLWTDKFQQLHDSSRSLVM